METITNNVDKVIQYLKKTGNFIYKYRYYIAIIIFILCIALEISGSSIGYWKNIIASNVTDDGVIFRNVKRNKK